MLSRRNVAFTSFYEGECRANRSSLLAVCLVLALIARARPALAVDDDVVYRVAPSASPKGPPAAGKKKPPAPAPAPPLIEVHGHVTKVTPEEAVLVRVAGGAIQAIPWDDVKRISLVTAWNTLDRDDVVLTKDGAELHGEVTEKNDRTVTLLETKRRTMIPVREIAKIARPTSYGKLDTLASPPVTPPPAAAPPAAAVPPPEARDDADTSGDADVMELADGTTHRGKFGELVWGDHVTLTEAGAVRRYDWADIVYCTRPKKTLAIKPVVTLEKNGVKLEASGKFDDAEKVRQAWLERGGSIVGYDASSSLMYLGISTSKGSLTAVGGGVTMHATFYFISPPSPEGDVSAWTGFRLGGGVETAALILTASSSKGSASIGAFDFTVPVAIGGQVGFGSFLGMDEWSGVLVGFDYKPSYSYTVIDGLPGVGSGNFLGFQTTLDFVDFHSVREGLEKEMREAGWRLTFFGIPPVSGLPLLLTLGVGAVWY